MISDQQTISADKHLISASYHYALVGLIILRHLFNKKINIQGSSVFDVGSGSGHWIDFLESNHEKYDSINAIGVLFHVDDDME